MTPSSPARSDNGLDRDSGEIDDGADDHFDKQRLQTPPNSSSRLENLPAEIRDQILFNMPALPALHALILASPVMHAQYQSNRNTLLGACLGRDLDGLLVDAYACVMSRVGKIGSPRTNEKIAAFLDSYRGWLSGSRSGLNLGVNAIAPSLVRWLASFHRTVVQPLARQYGTWALANLTKELTEGDQTIGLTRSEEIRICRALYRYHTYQHLFGRNKGKRRGYFAHHEINERFFCLFDPWDAEAVGCIELFLRQRYETIFDDVKADLHYESERFWSANGTFHPQGSFDLVAEHEKYMEGILSRGLKTAVLLLAIRNHEDLVAKMQRCLVAKGPDATMRRALEAVAQDLRRGLSTDPPTARDEAERRRDPLNFVGDAIPPNGPPLAWVLLWGGKYANLYGGYVPESLQRWGYVVWDEPRWLGARDLVAKQWETAPELVEAIKTAFNWSPVES